MSNNNRNSKEEYRILLKTPKAEVEFKDLCKKTYLSVNHILHLIEKEMNVDLHDYPEVRGYILDVSNTIKRLPEMVNEVIKYDN